MTLAGQSDSPCLQRLWADADNHSMSIDPDDQWASVAINESLVGRRPEESPQIRRPSSVISSLARLLHVHAEPHVNAWWLGRLPAGWHIFNDIPVGDRGANIDHLIVGPGGVFTVNAKNLTGKVWVAPRAIRHNGHPTDYLSKAVREAQRARRLLSGAVGHGIHVRPVIAILADGWTIKEMPPDVHVGAPRGVKNWMLHQPVVLSPSRITAICAAAAKPDTWRA